MDIDYSIVLAVGLRLKENVMINPEEVRCKECGGKVCICCASEIQWAAHCMDCDNSIGVRGYYDPCATSEEEAGELWIKLNTKVK
jgi:hypothetical protein